MEAANSQTIYVFPSARLGATQATALIEYHQKLSAALARSDLSTFVWPALLLAYTRSRVTLSEAAEVLDMPETAAIRWLKSLEDRGMISRCPEAQASFAITPAGQAAAEEALSRVN